MKTFKEYLLEHIIKRGTKWIVTDSSGKKILGTHSSKLKAKRQLLAIELSKQRRNEEE
jgi:hypothetical protein